MSDGNIGNLRAGATIEYTIINSGQTYGSNNIQLVWQANDGGEITTGTNFTEHGLWTMVSGPATIDQNGLVTITGDGTIEVGLNPIDGGYAELTYEVVYYQTNSVFIGGNAINKIYIGDTAVKKIMLGETQIFTTETEPTVPPEPAYYLTGEGGQGLYTAKLPLYNGWYFTPQESRPSSYYYYVTGNIDQQIADWFISSCSLLGSCQIRYKFGSGQWSEWQESYIGGMHEGLNCPYPDVGCTFLRPDANNSGWECPLIENPTDEETTLYVEMEMDIADDWVN